MIKIQKVMIWLGCELESIYYCLQVCRSWCALKSNCTLLVLVSNSGTKGRIIWIRMYFGRPSFSAISRKSTLMMIMNLLRAGRRNMKNTNPCSSGFRNMWTAIMFSCSTAKTPKSDGNVQAKGIVLRLVPVTFLVDRCCFH